MTRLIAWCAREACRREFAQIVNPKGGPHHVYCSRRCARKVKNADKVSTFPSEGWGQ